MPKKLKKRRLKPAVFPAGVKFVKFSSEDSLETSLKYLKAFFERRLIEKPEAGSFLLGSHFIKFIPENRKVTGAWQVSATDGQYVTIYSYSDVLNVFVSQKLPYNPTVLAMIERSIEEIQRDKIA